MKKRLRYALAAMLVVGAAFLIQRTTKQREPVYSGRTLNQWLDDYNQVGLTNKYGPMATKFAPIDEAIRSMGTNCLPFLQANILHGDSAIKRQFWELVKRQSLVKFQVYGEDSLRSPSLLALHALGDKAPPVLPVLARMLKRASGPEWEMAQMPLLVLGSNSSPVFERLCQSTNAEERRIAAFDLGQVNADLTVDCRWHNALVNDQPLAEVWVHSAEGGLDRAWARILRENTNSMVRLAVIETVIWWDSDTVASSGSDEIEQALASAKNDPDPAVRHAAAGHPGSPQTNPPTNRVP